MLAKTTDAERNLGGRTPSEVMDLLLEIKVQYVPFPIPGGYVLFPILSVINQYQNTPIRLIRTDDNQNHNKQ